MVEEEYDDYVIKVVVTKMKPGNNASKNASNARYRQSINKSTLRPPLGIFRSFFFAPNFQGESFIVS